MSEAVKDILGWMLMIVIIGGIVWAGVAGIRDRERGEQRSLQCSLLHGYYDASRSACLAVDSIITLRPTREGK